VRHSPQNENPLDLNLPDGRCSGNSDSSTDFVCDPTMHLIVNAAITMGNTTEVCCEDNGLFQGLPAPGYYMLQGQPKTLTACTPPVACVGGSFGQENCREGYTGRRCSACQSTEPKYFRSDGGCKECADVIPLPVLVTIAVILFICVALFADSFLSKVANTAELIAPMLILMSFYQTLSLLIKVEIAWPARLREVMNMMSFMNFNIELASPECSATFDANARMNLVLLSPVAVLTLIYIQISCTIEWTRAQIAPTVHQCY